MPTSVILKGLNDHDKKAIGSCDQRGVLRFASELGGGGGITRDALRKAETGLARLLFDLGLLRKPMTEEQPPAIELAMRLPNRNYLYAQTAGLFEPYVELGEDVVEGQPAGAIHFPQEPWREPWIATFADSGKVYAARTHAHTRMGDVLFMLHVPWKE
jgi:predicted deacylase